MQEKVTKVKVLSFTGVNSLLWLHIYYRKVEAKYRMQDYFEVGTAV